jgi:CheY-like chemotaxis protein
MKTILQIEDDQNDAFLFRRAMAKAGVVTDLQVAEDGQEGIDYIQGTGKFSNRSQFPLPSLILLDLKLPYVMGLDVLAWIKSNTATSMAVVIFSASAEQQDIADAYRLGAQGYLVKPSESSRLVEMVRALHDFWLVHNTPSVPFQPRSPGKGFVSSTLAEMNVRPPWQGPVMPAGAMTRTQANTGI